MIPLMVSSGSTSLIRYYLKIAEQLGYLPCFVEYDSLTLILEKSYRIGQHQLAIVCPLQIIVLVFRKTVFQQGTFT